MRTTETFKLSEWLYQYNLVTTVFEHTTDGDEAEPADRTVADPTDLKFVGRATAAAFETAEFDAQAVVEKAVSYRMLVDAGVNPGVAAKIRRWHSLQWSFESGDDLSRRSEQIRGLQADERAWVASSYGEESADAEGNSDAGSAAEPSADGDEEAEWVATAGDSEADGGDSQGDASDPFDAEASWVAGAAGEDDAETATADGSGDPVAAEAAWRERSKSTPLTDLDAVDDDDADRLSEAGVTSVRSLATADPELLAEVTGLPESDVEAWHVAATDRAD